MMIDSDVLIDVLRLRPEAVTWFKTLNSRQTISGATASELLFGSRNTVELNRLHKFFARFCIEWCTAGDLAESSKFAVLKLSNGVEILDAVTAATALRLNETLFTFNNRHFSVIPELSIVKPYVRK